MVILLATMKFVYSIIYYYIIFKRSRKPLLTESVYNLLWCSAVQHNE